MHHQGSAQTNIIKRIKIFVFIGDGNAAPFIVSATGEADSMEGKVLSAVVLYILTDSCFFLPQHRSGEVISLAIAISRDWSKTTST